MQNWSKSRIRPQIVTVVLFESFSNHCLANTVEPFRAANGISGRRLYDWRFITLDGQPVVSSSGLQVTPDGPIDGAEGDFLCVMPSYDFRDHAHQRSARKIKAAAKRHGVVIGLDTGSWVLARAGLLDGYRATIHWQELTAFEERFPLVNVVRERFVIDGDRITCSGALAAFDLVVELISNTHGTFLGLEVAQLFMSPRVTPNDTTTRGSADVLVGRAIAVMQECLEEPLAIAQIARRIGTTQKNLERQMRAEMNVTPQSLYRRLRLARARQLVHDSDHKIAEIATRCGYENASAMTRAFRQTYGATPSALRARRG